MADPTTPNMTLTEPVIGVTVGPAWATETNNNWTIVDQHDHSPGKGVLITPAGMNITADLTFQGNNLTNLKALKFLANGSPLSTAFFPESIYVAGQDLYYNDNSGNQVRITQSGAVVGPPGSITGLVPPASVTYVSGDETFVFQSDVNVPANLDGGSITLREVTTSPNGITLSSPTGLPANYTLTLPNALPGSRSLLSFDNSGTGSYTTPDGSTISIVSNTLEVPAGGIGTTQLASGAVTSAKVQNNINLPGTNVEINGNAATSSYNNGYSLKIVRGVIDPGGSILEGEGFTCVHGSPGNYTLAFTQPFSGIPAVVATLTSGSLSSYTNIFTNSLATTGFLVATATGGSTSDEAFSFIAIGPA